MWRNQRSSNIKCKTHKLSRCCMSNISHTILFSVLVFVRFEHCWECYYLFSVRGEKNQCLAALEVVYIMVNVTKKKVFNWFETLHIYYSFVMWIQKVVSVFWWFCSGSHFVHKFILYLIILTALFLLFKKNVSNSIKTCTIPETVWFF